MDWIIDGISVFVVSLLLTGIIIPQILLIAFRKSFSMCPTNGRFTKEPFRVWAA